MEHAFHGDAAVDFGSIQARPGNSFLVECPGLNWSGEARPKVITVWHSEPAHGTGYLLQRFFRQV